MLVQLLIKHLKELLSTELKSTRCVNTGEDVFFDFYYLGENKRAFTDEEKNIVGPLLATALPHLTFCLHGQVLTPFPTPINKPIWLHNFGPTFYSKYYKENCIDAYFEIQCIIRSGIEYLRDGYTNFPTEKFNINNEKSFGSLMESYFDVGVLTKYDTLIHKFYTQYKKDIKHAYGSSYPLGGANKHWWWPSPTPTS